MAKKHGARQQKRAAKQKAKRQAKRDELARRTSKDPTVRLQRTDNWPVVEADISTSFWEDGIGYLVIGRRDPEGGIVASYFLVDVLCLGVKDAFWRAMPTNEFREMVEDLDKSQGLSPIEPACLVKILEGAVAFAESFGFRPHADYRRAAMLLGGIDPADCKEEFEYGENGLPVYFQGPNETPAEVRAIIERVTEVGGQFVAAPPGLAGARAIEADEFDDEDADEFDDEDDIDDEPGDGGWRWVAPPRRR